MKIDPYPPIPPASFEAMCRQWTDVILAEESGTWIWAPLNAPYRRIWQFQNDKKLQKKLLGEDADRHMFIHVDFEQRQTISKEICYQMTLQAIRSQELVSFPPADDLIGTIDDLLKKNKCILNLFVTGIDATIRSNQWDAIEELNYIATRNWDTHILLVTETDITEPIYFSSFSKRTTLAQNITTTPLYSPVDTQEFITYIAFNWGVRMNKSHRDWIWRQCGGHFLLSKDALRVLRKQPGISTEKLAASPSLHMRAQAIVDNLLGNQRDVLWSVLDRKPIPKTHEHAKQFLLEQGWIIPDGRGYRLTIPLLEEAIRIRSRETTPSEADFHLLLTKLEKNVFDFLEKNANQVTSREHIGQILWGKDWEEKYSDWAIDKLMHRVRTKLERSNSGIKILTKKGQGFVLIKS